LQLSREIGVSYNTAWKLKHKVLHAMLEENQREGLSGRIDFDDVYLGGERSGKRGRGAKGKVPFIAPYRRMKKGIHSVFTCAVWADSLGRKYDDMLHVLSVLAVMLSAMVWGVSAHLKT
jgi:hypothetical protein